MAAAATAISLVQSLWDYLLHFRVLDKTEVDINSGFSPGNSMSSKHSVKYSISDDVSTSVAVFF